MCAPSAACTNGTWKSWTRSSPSRRNLLRFAARGAYATTAGVGYPWLDGEVLVEPFRETTLYAVNHNGEAVTWMVNGAHAVGEETARTFDEVGEHSVWLSRAWPCRPRTTTSTTPSAGS